MTPDNATQCDARHGNERCRKAAHHAPADPWHESANYMWQRVPAPNSAPSFAAPADEPASAWLARECAASPQARYLRDELAQIEWARKTAEAERNEARRDVRALLALLDELVPGGPCAIETDVRSRVQRWPAPSFFGASPVPVDETAEELRAQRDNAERICVRLFDLFRAERPDYAWDVDLADKEAIDDMRERVLALGGPSFAPPSDEPVSVWLERQCAASPQARYLRDELDQLRHAAKENETLTAEQNEVRRSRWRAEALCVRLAAFIVDQDVADRFDDLVVHWREDIDAMRERLAVLP